MKKITSAVVTLAAVAAWHGTPAIAQDTTDTAATAPAHEDDDNDFPWGLLGLAGLAGLLGRKRRDDHVRTDTRR